MDKRYRRILLGNAMEHLAQAGLVLSSVENDDHRIKRAVHRVAQATQLLDELVFEKLEEEKDE